MDGVLEVREPIEVHIDRGITHLVWWATWTSRRGAGYAAADSLRKLRRLLPRGRRLQLVDEYGHPTEYVVVTTFGSVDVP